MCGAKRKGSRAYTVTIAQWLPSRLDGTESHEKYTGHLQQKQKRELGPKHQLLSRVIEIVLKGRKEGFAWLYQVGY